MKKLLSILAVFVSDLIKDDTGQPSSMRLMMLFMAVTIMYGWLDTVLRQGWVDPPWPAISTLVIGKSAQKILEHRP